MQYRPEVFNRIEEIFFPHYRRTKENLQTNNIRLSHYTTADTAIKIIENSEFWLRNTSIMNDYMEVKHGADCIEKAMSDEPGRKLTQALEGCAPGLTDDILGLFKAWTPSILSRTFVASFSEHTHQEDQYGRLSMWRAYGGAAGVALVFKNAPFIGPSLGVSLTCSPVAYIDYDDVAKELEAIAYNILTNLPFLQTLGIDQIRGTMFATLRSAAVCIKHPAFKEEQEWRVIASHDMFPSKELEPFIFSIGGIPQPVIKLGLRDRPEMGVTGLHISEILERVLIGPCGHSDIIRTALIATMEKAGVSDPASKILDTKIPLRPNQR